MKDFARFLRQHPLWWILPILILAAALVWLASIEAATPDSPFTYRL